jgi:hypothetical protein
MIRRALIAAAGISLLLLIACNSGTYALSGIVSRTSPGIPDNCLVALYDAASVDITTSLPAPLYSTTVTFTSSSAAYSINDVPKGTYYMGSFLGVDSGTLVDTAESGCGATMMYANPFPLKLIDITIDTVVDISSTDWVGFP